VLAVQGGHPGEAERADGPGLMDAARRFG